MLNVSIILCGLNSKQLSGAASGRSSAAAPLANEDQRRCLRLISFKLAQRCFVRVIYTARSCRALPEGLQCVCDVWRRLSLDCWVKNVLDIVAMQTGSGTAGEYLNKFMQGRRSQSDVVVLHRKKAEYLKCCMQTFRCNKLKSIRWKTLNQVKVLSPYFLFFLSTSDLNEESSPTNFIDNKQRTWHPGRLVPVDRSHARDTDRSRGGSRGTASRRRGVYSSSSFPAEVVSELSLHTAAITVPERVFTFNQPEINLRDVWPETWQDVWHRTRVCLLAGCLY